MKRISLFFLLLTAFSAAVYAQANRIESVYTTLGEKACTRIPQTEVFVTRSKCPGTAGFQLELTDNSNRQDLIVIFPDGSRGALDFNNTAPPGYAVFGAKAEWRVRRAGQKITPFALIVQFESRDQSASPKNKSHLVVSKITNKSACITDILDASGTNRNLEARRLAENAAQKPCLLESKIPKFIEQLAGEDESKAYKASVVLINIGPGVVVPLLEKMKQSKLCDFQILAAQIILKLDKNNAVLKPTLFDLARGRCKYRYPPEKYLPDANFSGVMAQFKAAELLVSEIEGGILLLPELKYKDGSAMISLIDGLRGAMILLGNKNKAELKPDVIRALKATVPLVVTAVEKKGGKICVDFYEILQWMRQSGIGELRDEVNRRLEGKTISCQRGN